MKRTTLVGLLVILMLIAAGLYLGVLLLLRNSVAEESDPLTSRDPDFAQPQAPVGDPNPYAGKLQAPLFDPMIPVSDFTLPSTQDETFKLSEADKPITLLYFGYLTCPDFCPTTMAELQRLFRDLGARANDIQVLFLTVDPERDQLELLKRYVQVFDERFVGLRGEPAEIQPIIDEFGVTAVKREVESALGYLVDHTASVFVLDDNLNLIARFPYGTPHEDLLADVQALLGE